jgi:hypothetical protein
MPKPNDVGAQAVFPIRISKNKGRFHALDRIHNRLRSSLLLVTCSIVRSGHHFVPLRIIFHVEDNDGTALTRQAIWTTVEVNGQGKNLITGLALIDDRSSTGFSII